MAQEGLEIEAQFVFTGVESLNSGWQACFQRIDGLFELFAYLYANFKKINPRIPDRFINAFAFFFKIFKLKN